MYHVIIVEEDELSKFQDFLEPAEDEEVQAISKILQRKPSCDMNSVQERSFLEKRALAYIKEHCCEKMKLAEVAEKLYINPFYLSKILNKKLGKSFTELLNEARVCKAKQLLKNPAFRVCDVSEMVGFYDVSHFCRVFKKIEGVSANEYRKTLVTEYSMGYVWKIKKVLDFYGKT